MKQEMMGWQWHPLNHMQIICTSFQTDNHTSTSSLRFFTGGMLFLMPKVSKHWRYMISHCLLVDKQQQGNEGS